MGLACNNSHHTVDANSFQGYRPDPAFYLDFKETVPLRRGAGKRFLRRCIFHPSHIMPDWKLPLEVCEEIIDDVAQDVWVKLEPPISYRSAIHDLYACSLTCRSWVPRSRINLFRRIQLSSQEQAGLLRASFDKSQRLREFVEYLCIDCLIGQGQSNGWIYYIFRDLPSCFPNLRRLELRNLPFLRATFILTTSWFNNVKSLSLQHLMYQSFREAIQLVNALTNLEELTITNCTWSSPGYYYPSRAPHRLTTLSVTGLRPDLTPDPFNWVVTSHSASLLTKLQLDVYEWSSEMQHVLHSSSRTLRVLFVTFQKVAFADAESSGWLFCLANSKG